jgi:FKBP-type peptidyl-prolyl cis-trans isomerase FkpA
MKAAPTSTPARPLSWLPAFLAVSLIANGVLAWLTFHARPASTVATPPPAQPEVAKSAKPIGELAPYAALGSFVAENNRIADLKWSNAQFEAFQNGLRASYEGRGYPLDDDARKLRDDISARVQKMLAAEQPNPVEDYFKNLRDKEGVQRTASGLHYRITEEGTGQMPTAASTVVISYSARLPSGETLPALSRSRVRTAVNDLLPGLREGVQLLHRAGKALVYVPAALSYGDGEWPPGITRGAPIVFFLELHDVGK